MKISSKWLEERQACNAGKEWFRNQSATSPLVLIDALIKADKLDWANWFIVRVMGRKQSVKYAIFAAEEVIDIYENKYPENKAPRNAIKAAKRYITTCAASTAATAAAYAAAAYAAAAYAAAFAAVADAATVAATAAADAAYASAPAPAAVKVAVKKQMKLKILIYGIKLLKREKGGG